MPIHSVITGDIVNSTKLPGALEKSLVKAIHEIFQPYPFEFYRGDSFQAYIREGAKSLQKVLLCRTVAIGLTPDDSEPISDVRISIGIGEIEGSVAVLGSAKGEAFLLSGRSFDELEKTEARLIITSGNNLANTGLQVIADYINAIFKMMTGKQAEVIFELLKGQTQQEVAKLLKRSKSTIHQHVISGRWNEVEKLLKQYENIINQLL